MSDIEDLPPAVQEKLFDEVLDRDVQKGTKDLLNFIYYTLSARNPQSAFI